MIRVATLTVQTTKAGSKQPAFLSDRDANYRPLETRPIFRRVDETKDHVAIIVWIRGQRINPVVIANGIRIAAQVTLVLHIDKRIYEPLVENLVALNDVPEDR